MSEKQERKGVAHRDNRGSGVTAPPKATGVAASHTLGLDDS